jgi:hypothetical protein
VEYNDEKIRFAWRIDESVSHVAGNIKFEIHVDGAIVDTNGNSYAYRWKSKPTDKFTILKSLCEDSDCEPISVGDDWVVEIVESITTVVAEKVADSVAEKIAGPGINSVVRTIVDDAITWGVF